MGRAVALAAPPGLWAGLKACAMALHHTLMRSAGLEQVMRTQGLDVELITPTSQVALEMTGLATVETSRVVDDDRGKRIEKTRTVTIFKDAAHAEFSGHAGPEENWLVRVDGLEYAVTAREDCTDYWQLQVKRLERSERTRPELRKMH